MNRRSIEVRGASRGNWWPWSGSSRFAVAVAVSLVAHLAAVILLVGSGLWEIWPSGATDIEVTGMTLDELEDLPLGAPASGEGAGERPASHPRAKTPTSDGTLDAPTGDAKKDKGAAAEDASSAETAPPRPTSVRSYAPQGSRVTALMRIDRLRGTPYQAATDDLLMLLPDRRDLLDGTGIDLYRDIDALLIATPNPLDATVTLLAARHRLSDAALRAALERGARETGRSLKWRSERGRPFAERHREGAAETAPNTRRDRRLVLLAAPHLVVVTPPAYRSLILQSGNKRGERGERGAAPAAISPIPARDGGASDATTSGEATAPAPSENGWAALLRRIDAEDSIMPADAVVMISAVDVFSARSARRALRAVPGTRGMVDDDTASAAGASARPQLFGLPAPESVTATIGVSPQPFADVQAEMGGEAAAQRWQEEWPRLRNQLLSNPIIVLTGFGGLIRRVTVTREKNVVTLHLDSTADETMRLLRLVTEQMRAFGG